jgi:hypothetical protein
MSTVDEPPPFQSVNVIQLDSVADSTITGVSVYSKRAEITRLFKFNIKTGQNQLNISGLPGVLDRESLRCVVNLQSSLNVHILEPVFRVEGRGSATIHGVTISTIVPPPSPTSSDTLKELLNKKRRIEKACERAEKSLTGLETYLESLKIEHLAASNLRDVINSYDKAAEELDDRITGLENELAETDEAISVEKARLSGPVGNPKLNLKVSVGVFADSEGAVSVALIYGGVAVHLCFITDINQRLAVHSATWNAGYDIRVDMKTKDKPVTLTYKAGIVQDTGEVRIIPSSFQTTFP